MCIAVLLQEFVILQGIYLIPTGAPSTIAPKAFSKAPKT